MASVNWQKTNTVKLARMGCHFDNEKREKVNHTNKDIQKDKVEGNYYLGVNSYKEILERSKKYIADVDKRFPPKKKVKPEDRVTMCSLEFPCPRIITDNGLSKDFFKAAEAVLQEQFGNSYMGGVVHVDEVHDYLDPVTKKITTSCEHADVWVCADCCWTDNKGNVRQGINGKNFMTKKRMSDLNKAINEMCLERFNVPYLTGGESRNISVEQLKQDSYTSLKREVRDMQRQIVNLTNERDMILKENDFFREEIIILQKEVRELTEEKSRGEIAIGKLENEFERLQDQLKSKELELDIKTTAYKTLQAEFDSLLDATVERKEQKEISRWDRESTWQRSRDVEYSR